MPGFEPGDRGAEPRSGAIQRAEFGRIPIRAFLRLVSYFDFFRPLA